MLSLSQASLAGVHRLPEHVSTGLALMIGSREADLTQIPGAALGVPRSSLTGATAGALSSDCSAPALLFTTRLNNGPCSPTRR